MSFVYWIVTLYERIGGHEGLRNLLHHFYADVRQHKVIGPIFNERIADWNHHLAIIAEFWSLQTGGPSSYAGGMAAKHLPLSLRAEHFDFWLELWDFNCRRHLQMTEASELSALACEFAARLKRIVRA